ncbi:MAG: hypothetical protein LAT64_06475 [Phycisphaerales bacterium]|nr:hypothetical protein [Planctomycetota bacterium]MCH8508401.1 hypothetical protein [Phycisphaerales bacterium]
MKPMVLAMAAGGVLFTSGLAAAGSGSSGLVVLNPQASGALTMNGNASVEVPARVVYVNSSSETAVTTNGRAILDTPALYVVGRTHFNGQSGATGSVFHGAPSFYDPYAVLPIPATDGMTEHDAVDIKKNGEVVSLSPGYYPHGLKITGRAEVFFEPGVFVIGGPGLVITSGDVIGSGVCLVIASGECRIAGTSSLSLSPMSSGSLQGMVLVQPSTNTTEMRLAGGSEFSIGGTIYVPNAKVTLVGNSTVEGEGPQMGDLLLADRVELSGTATIRIGRDGMRRVSLPTYALFD